MANLTCERPQTVNRNSQNNGMKCSLCRRIRPIRPHVRRLKRKWPERSVRISKILWPAVNLPCARICCRCWKEDQLTELSWACRMRSPTGRAGCIGYSGVGFDASEFVVFLHKDFPSHSLAGHATDSMQKSYHECLQLKNLADGWRFQGFMNGSCLWAFWALTAPSKFSEVA